MMTFLNLIYRKALGLLVVAAMLCGFSVAKGEKLTDHDHQPSDGCHMETVDSHTHCDDMVDCCGDGDHEPCDDTHGKDCPDTPHHHHKGAGCCHAASVHAARMAPVSSLRAPIVGRALVEWGNQCCDLDAVRELDLPPII